MKKILFSLLVVFTLLLTGCSNGNIENIKYDALKTKIENKESFILYVGTSSSLKTNLNKVLEENNLTAFALSVDKLSDEQKLELNNKISFSGNEIIFVKEGIDPSKKSHITDEYSKEKEIYDQLVNMGFITVLEETTNK